jgi:hypothetical protein
MMKTSFYNVNGVIERLLVKKSSYVDESLTNEMMIHLTLLTFTVQRMISI